MRRLLYSPFKLAWIFVGLVAFAQMSVDSQGNVSVNSISTGVNCPGCAGFFRASQGTSPVMQPNSFYLYAPTSIPTSYSWQVPSAQCTGYIYSTNGVLSCQTGPSGGSGTTTTGEVLIASQVLSTPASSVVFSNIPNTYKDLRLSYHAKGDAAVPTLGLNIQINGDSGLNYSYYSVNSLNPGSGTSLSSIPTGIVEGTSNGPSFAGNGWIYFTDYTNSVFQKSLLSFNGGRFNSTTPYISIIYGEWTGTGVISQITCTPSTGNFTAASTFTLWGVF